MKSLDQLINHIIEYPGRASITGFAIVGVSTMDAIEWALKIVLLLISISLGALSLYRKWKGKDDGYSN